MNLTDFFAQYAGQEVKMNIKKVPIGGGQTFVEKIPDKTILKTMQADADNLGLGINLRFNFIDADVSDGGTTDMDPNRVHVLVEKDENGVYRIGEYEEDDINEGPFL